MPSPPSGASTTTTNRQTPLLPAGQVPWRGPAYLSRRLGRSQNGIEGEKTFRRPGRCRSRLVRTDPSRAASGEPPVPPPAGRDADPAPPDAFPGRTGDWAVPPGRGCLEGAVPLPPLPLPDGRGARWWAGRTCRRPCRPWPLSRGPSPPTRAGRSGRRRGGSGNGGAAPVPASPPPASPPATACPSCRGRRRLRCPSRISRPFRLRCPYRLFTAAPRVAVRVGHRSRVARRRAASAPLSAAWPSAVSLGAARRP